MRFSWRDLLIMVRRWANEPGTALSAAVHGHELWSQEMHMLANIVDVLQVANWQRANRKGAPKPKPVERPGDKKRRTKTIGADPIPIAQFDDWWNSKSKK